MSETPDPYVHGHHESVLRSHNWRTVENSAAYLLPHLTPGADLLDIGCGPGTITLDFAKRLNPGSVVGVDPVASVLVEAERVKAEEGIENATFRVGDVYDLDVPDDHYDVVHAHQVLQHLADPVRALKEMRRVVKPGGIVAVRDADYSAMTWSPKLPELDRWLDLYHQITEIAGVEADAGRYLLGWTQEAGFTDVDVSSATWTFATKSRRAWWGGVWADRVVHSSYAEQVLQNALADRTELEAISEGWKQWSVRPDGFFAVIHGEVIARK